MVRVPVLLNRGGGTVAADPKIGEKVRAALETSRDRRRDRVGRGRRVRGALQSNRRAGRFLTDRRRRRRDDQRGRVCAGRHGDEARHPAARDAQPFRARPRYSDGSRRGGGDHRGRQRAPRRRRRDERPDLHQQQRHRALSADGRRPRPQRSGSAEASGWRWSSPRFGRLPASVTSA